MLICAIPTLYDICCGMSLSRGIKYNECRKMVMAFSAIIVCLGVAINSLFVGTVHIERHEISKILNYKIGDKITTLVQFKSTLDSSKYNDAVKGTLAQTLKVGDTVYVKTVKTFSAVLVTTTYNKDGLNNKAALFWYKTY